MTPTEPGGLPRPPSVKQPTPDFGSGTTYSSLSLSTEVPRQYITTTSRYLADFEELEFLGRGAFGEVVKAKNRLDGRYYAIKKIKLKSNEAKNQKVLREVTTLSRLHHEHVVRYYQAWTERIDTSVPSSLKAFSPGDSRVPTTSSSSSDKTKPSSVAVAANKSKRVASPATLPPPHAARKHPRRGSDALDNDYADDDDDDDEDEEEDDDDVAFGKAKRGGIRVSRGKYGRRHHREDDNDDDDEDDEEDDEEEDEEDDEEDDEDDDEDDDDDDEDAEFASSYKDVFHKGGMAFGAHDDDDDDEDDDDDMDLGYVDPSDTACSNGSGSKQDTLVPVEDDDDDDDDEEEEEEDLFDNAIPGHDTYDDDDYDDNSDSDDDDESADLERTVGGRRAKRANKYTAILYIQMEYCTKRTLRSVIDDGVLFDDENEMWRLFRQILEGLHHIHQHGTVHRDLKPLNIFMDDNNNCQIGDFGLAVSGTSDGRAKLLTSQSVLEVSVMLDAVSSSALAATTDVGTPVYCAPEVGRAGYDQKVDMYSLGIILFEMCYRFATGTERAYVLNDLRNHLRFPPEFDKRHPNQHAIISLLLQPNPQRRPSAAELLDSELLPTQLEAHKLQQALRSITTPNTTNYNRLIERLFSLTPEEQLSYTYDSHQKQRMPNRHTAAVRSHVVAQLEAVFKRHAAFRFDTPLLLPKASLASNIRHPVQFLDESGSLVVLPYELTTSFASFVGLQGIPNMRRYTFANIYRKNAVHGQPLAFGAANFDIVGPRVARVIHQAEVMRVCVEVCARISTYSSFLSLVCISVTNNRWGFGVLGL